MDEHLKLLIIHYESEQQQLQALLDNCLSEQDYKFANYYLKNLTFLRETLFNLYSLSDHNYAEVAELLQKLSNLELVKKKIDTGSPFIEKELESLQTKLSLLKESTVIEVEEKHDIENAIIHLLEKKVTGFKLFISREYNLYLDFALAKADVVHIEFTPFDALYEEHSIDNLLSNSEIELLKRNGFRLNDNANVLSIDFDLKGRSTQTLIVFLSKVFFYILHWHKRKNFELSIY